MTGDTKKPADSENAAVQAVYEFCYFGGNEDRRLSQFERLTMLGGKELERAVEWLKRSGVKALPFAEIENIDVDQLERATKFFDNCTGLFSPISNIAHVKKMPIHGLPDGGIFDVEFASGYKPHSKEVSSKLYNAGVNNTVSVRLWEHHGEGRPLLVAIHGWAMGDQRINSVALLPGFFYLQGFDVAVIELPFHGRRKIDGVVFPSADPFLNAEGVAQAISDIRSLRYYLQPKNLFALGISFGGYLAGLWASLDTLDGIVVVSPVVELGEAAWDLLSKQEKFPEIKSRGVSRELLSRASMIHSPLARPSKIPPGQSLIVAGLTDEVLGPRQAKLLWDHWRGSKIVRVMGGHVGELAEGTTALHEITTFLNNIRTPKLAPSSSI